MLAAAAVVTGVAVVGGFGLLPSSPEDATAASKGIAPAAQDLAEAPRERDRPPTTRRRAPAVAEAAPRTATSPPTTRTAARATTARTTPPLPADSGSGRRVVFSEGGQRVWLVDEDGAVRRTYLASGSVYDNLDPGTYQVFSRSRHAVGIEGSGTMEYFVRFTHGDAGAAIGFHTIPVDDGEPVQTVAQLGTPLSHGCIRQRTPDAIALWEFAPLGTTVVVTA